MTSPASISSSLGTKGTDPTPCEQENGELLHLQNVVILETKPSKLALG
jgi:hypothetical protein